MREPVELLVGKARRPCVCCAVSHLLHPLGMFTTNGIPFEIAQEALRASCTAIALSTPGEFPPLSRFCRGGPWFSLLIRKDYKLVSTIEQQREQVLHVLRENLNPREYRSIEGLLRSSIRFITHRVADECDLALGASKVGGLPDLPPAIPWPVVEVPPQAQEGLLRQSRHLVGSDVPLSPLSSVRQTHRALPFLCQIALADIAPLEKEHLLPEDGLLLFFADVELDLWMDIARGVHEKKEDWRAWKVIYVPAQSPLSRVSPPENFLYQLSYHPCTLWFQHEWCLPDEDNPLLPFYREVFAFIAWRQFPQTPEEPVHRLLGYEQPIQGDVSMVLSALSGSRRSRDQMREAGTAPWQLLLQLDTDEKAGMNWGDLGRLYFCLSQEDMQNRCFEHPAGLWQQY